MAADSCQATRNNKMKHPLRLLPLLLCWLLPSFSSAATVELLFAYGSEKQPWVEAVTDNFNQAGIRTRSGKRIHVTGKPMGSGAAMNEVLAGRLKAHIVSPASEVFVTLANQDWQQRRGADLVGPTRQLVLSPVVIAMWKPIAEALGWPDKPIGWSDILDMANRPEGWTALGHPEWGRFKFGHTHPYHSNSGLISLLAEVYAATGKTRGLNLADVDQPATQEYLHAIEKSVVHYGKSTGFFGRKMLANGPGYLSAAVLYENMVIESYTKGNKSGVPLVAIYPKEGTFWSDHPAGIVQREWVGDEQREAAGLYLDYLAARPQQLRAMEFGFRPADVDLALRAPLDAAHGVDPEQPQTTLKVPKAKVVRAVMDLWKQRKKHANLVLVMDVSGSMKSENRIQYAREAALKLIDLMGNQDRFSLLTFNDNTHWKLLGADLAKDRNEARGAVQRLRPGGRTALYDAVVTAYDYLRDNPDPERIAAVVVLTDGADTRSVTKPLAMLRRVQLTDQHPVRIFPIAYAKGASLKVLQSIADATQTKAYSGDPGNIDKVFRDISTFF